MSNPRAIENALNDAAFKNIEQQIRERLATVRDPETGEFATVSIEGNSLENMKIAIEGSRSVINLAIERVREMGVTEDAIIAKESGEDDRPLYAFISYAGADESLAISIAENLNTSGINSFLAKWDIRAGDSIPEKINQALDRTTHFLVLFTPRSQAREWVKVEMDAGLMLRIEGKCKQFIALRQGISAIELPPLIKPWHSPSLDDFEPAIKQLISDLQGLSRRPPLGQAPAPLVLPKSQSVGLSKVALAIAKLFIESSETGRNGDPHFDPSELIDKTGFTDEDIVDAVDELEGKGYVKTLKAMGQYRLGFAAITAQAALFSELDHLFKLWNPEQDAQLIAADLVNKVIEGHVQKAAEHYGWPARRINPAIKWLKRRGLINTSHEATGGTPWYTHWIMALPETRRFVKARSAA